MNDYKKERIIQSDLIILLEKFDALCRKNRIHYTLDAGTLLGAVRHKGFIPWDDDADIGLIRSEYEKLAKSSFDKSGIELDTTNDRIKKIWLKTMDGKKLWIDVFIYDYISEKKFVDKIKMGIITLMIPFTKTKETLALSDFRGNTHGIKKLIFHMIYHIGNIFPLKARLRWFDSFCRKWFNGSKQYVFRSDDRYEGMKKIVSRSLFSSYQRVQFENIKLMTIKNTHELLCSSYGADYMKPQKWIDTQSEVHSVIRNIKD